MRWAPCARAEPPYKKTNKNGEGAPAWFGGEGGARCLPKTSKLFHALAKQRAKTAEPTGDPSSSNPSGPKRKVMKRGRWLAARTKPRTSRHLGPCPETDLP